MSQNSELAPTSASIEHQQAQKLIDTIAQEFGSPDRSQVSQNLRSLQGMDHENWDANRRALDAQVVALGFPDPQIIGVDRQGEIFSGDGKGNIATSNADGTPKSTDSQIELGDTKPREFAAATKDGTEYLSYTVQPKDTLWSIAKSVAESTNGIGDDGNPLPVTDAEITDSYKEIAKLNGIKNANLIIPGESLLIPMPAAKGAATLAAADETATSAATDNIAQPAIPDAEGVTAPNLVPEVQTPTPTTTLAPDTTTPAPTDSTQIDRSYVANNVVTDGNNVSSVEVAPLTPLTNDADKSQFTNRVAAEPSYFVGSTPDLSALQDPVAIDDATNSGTFTQGPNLISAIVHQDQREDGSTVTRSTYGDTQPTFTFVTGRKDDGTLQGVEFQNIANIETTTAADSTAKTIITVGNDNWVIESGSDGMPVAFYKQPGN